MNALRSIYIALREYNKIPAYRVEMNELGIPFLSITGGYDIYLGADIMLHS